MRLTTRTNLAMRTLMLCALDPARVFRKHEIAAACNASENHLAQVIHLLAKRGFLRTMRGRSGGLMLGRAADQITVGQVFREFEAVLPVVDCLDPEGTKCPFAGACRLTCVLAEALEAFYARLDRETIADLVAGNTGLSDILKAA